MIAGSPKSPIVCVSEDRATAKLIDLRDGRVLDRTGPERSLGREPGDTVPIVGFNEIQMSPDGRTLYHTRWPQLFFRTDVSTGKFVGNHLLATLVEPVSTSFFSARIMHLSPDGKYLAAITTTKLHERGYAMVDPTRDPRSNDEEPFLAPNATSFTFAGPNNRPVGNAGVDGRDNRGFGRVNYHLLLPARGFVGRGYQMYSNNRLEDSILVGAPTSDHVLLCAGEVQTKWITLPPPSDESASEQGAVLKKASVHTSLPPTEQKFAVPKNRGRSNSDNFAKVELGEARGISISASGDRLYIFCRHGSVWAFDTETLRADRYAGLLMGPDDPYTLLVTKAGPMLRLGNRDEVVPLDAETLDCHATFMIRAKNVAASPASNAFAVTDGQNNLHVYDVRNGKSIALVTQKQFDQLEPPDADLKATNAGSSDVAISTDGTILVCRYHSWHVFSLSDEALKPLGVVVPPKDKTPLEDCAAFPVPQSGDLYFRNDTNVYRFPILKELGPEHPIFHLPDGEDLKPLDLHGDKVLAYGPTGLIYCRPIDKNELRVYNTTGEVVYSGVAFSGSKRKEEIAPQPNRPERVFVIGEHDVHIADLEPATR
jgi:hypothetical protein